MYIEENNISEYSKEFDFDVKKIRNHDFNTMDFLTEEFPIERILKILKDNKLTANISYSKENQNNITFIIVENGELLIFNNFEEKDTAENNNEYTESIKEIKWDNKFRIEAYKHLKSLNNQEWIGIMMFYPKNKNDYNFLNQNYRSEIIKKINKMGYNTLELMTNYHEEKDTLSFLYTTTNDNYNEVEESFPHEFMIIGAQKRFSGSRHTYLNYSEIPFFKVFNASMDELLKAMEEKFIWSGQEDEKYSG